VLHIGRVLDLSAGQCYTACDCASQSCISHEGLSSTFISPGLWPSNSLDMNPADYKILGIML